MSFFSLSHDFSLEITQERVEILVNGHYRSNSFETSFLYFRNDTKDINHLFRCAIAVIYPMNDEKPLTRFDLSNHAISEGNAIIEGYAQYSHGIVEEWHISFSTVTGNIQWKRKSVPGISEKNFKFILPRQSRSLELWHTSEGNQIVNEAIPGYVEGKDEKLEQENESEVLYYSVNPRNCLLFNFSDKGSVRINKRMNLRDPLPGEPDWEINSDHQSQERIWEFIFHGSAESLEISCGIKAAVTNFTGRKKLNIPDLSADFGNFYYYIFLACLPINLRIYGQKYVAPRCNTLIGPVECYKDAWSRDATWAFEFMYAYDPISVAELIEDFINASLENASEQDGMSPAPGTLGYKNIKTKWYWDDAAAEILMMAGRHYWITGDLEFAHKNLSYYRRCANYLLSLRRNGEPLPITTYSWDGQGVVLGKEPYFVAECHAGLRRLSAIEEALGNTNYAQKWLTVSDEMKQAALLDYKDGGLWHTERGTFINYIDYRDPALLSPRLTNWSKSELQETGVALEEFSLYETMMPIWLGLMDDVEKVEKAYTYIDKNYNYANGRGDMTLPPSICQNFMSLMDVCIRQKYGIKGADRILQLILDHAFDGGIPLTEKDFGAFKCSGPQNPDWEYPFYPMHHSGRPWDNSPYFGLALQIHYGLDYSFKGFKVSMPKRIGNYDITMVKGLIHKEAIYDFRWIGSGKIKEVRVDGLIWEKEVIDHKTGLHEVVILLG